MTMVIWWLLGLLVLTTLFLGLGLLRVFKSLTNFNTQLINMRNGISATRELVEGMDTVQQQQQQESAPGTASQLQARMMRKEFDEINGRITSAFQRITKTENTVEGVRRRTEETHRQIVDIANVVIHDPTTAALQHIVGEKWGNQAQHVSLEGSIDDIKLSDQPNKNKRIR